MNAQQFAPDLSLDAESVIRAADWRIRHGPGLDDPLIALVRDHGTYPRELYYVTDGAGRHYAVAESTGTIHPDVWGEAVSGYIGFRSTGAVTKSHSFGEERLATASGPGLSFFRNRVNDQDTGRWIHEDPIGLAGGINLHQFNGNDPASYDDPYGLCPWCIGAVTGVVTGFAIAKLTGSEYTLRDAATDAALGAVGAGLTSKLGKLRAIGRAAGGADDAMCAGRVAVSELRPTHSVSNRAVQRLADDIAENGVREPLKYVEHNGTKYVVDGNHRLHAARRLGLDDVPAERVELPYKGYRTIESVLESAP